MSLEFTPVRTPMKPTKSSVSGRIASAVIGLISAFIPAVVLAQDQSAPAASGSPAPVPTAEQMKEQVDADRVVQMEAFQVTTDIGAYHEETSSMATKIATSLKELSSSLQILNSNAITDRNAISLQDVYNYVVGIYQSQTNTNGFTFRGFPNSGTFTQNIEYDGIQGGMFNHSATAAGDVEALEFLKGPNSVLYGQMHPGGLLNIVTKNPQAVEAVNVRAYVASYGGRYNQFGSEASAGGEIDATGPIDKGKHWLYRVIVDVQDNKPFRPADYDRQFQIYPSLTYRWNPGTFIRAKIEFGQDKRRYDDGILPIFTGPSIPVYSLNGVVTSSAAYGENARYELPKLNTVYQDPTDVSRDKGESFSLQFQKRWDDNWTLRVQTRSVWHTDAVTDLDTNNVSILLPKTPAYATPATTFSRQYNHNTNGHRYNFFDANLHGAVGPEKFLNNDSRGSGRRPGVLRQPALGVRPERLAGAQSLRARPGPVALSRRRHQAAESRATRSTTSASTSPTRSRSATGCT